MNPRETQVILKAAKVIRAKGFDATTINDISEATGLTKGGLYHYINSKQDLLYRIVTLAMDLTFAEVVDKVRDIDDPEQQLAEVVRRHVDLTIRDQGVLSALSEEVGALNRKQASQILRRKREYFDFVRGILRRLKRQGKLASVHPSVAAFNIFAMILFCPRWYRRDGALDARRVADEILHLALHGIVAKPARKR